MTVLLIEISGKPNKSINVIPAKAGIHFPSLSMNWIARSRVEAGWAGM
jgi:hypothetical protein